MGKVHQEKAIQLGTLIQRAARCLPKERGLPELSA